MKTNVKKACARPDCAGGLIAVFWGVYRQFSPKAQSGEKQITISIVDDTGTQSDYALNTDAGIFWKRCSPLRRSTAKKARNTAIPFTR